MMQERVIKEFSGASLGKGAELAQGIALELDASCIVAP